MTQSIPTYRPLVTSMGVDIGYGHTKLAMGAGTGSGSGPTTASLNQTRAEAPDVISFPSTVILSRGAVQHGGVLANHAVDSVDDGTAHYLYGDSAIDADDGASARSLDTQFANSTEYAILLKACLQRRQYPLTVERLVLGVPFDRVQTAAGVLKSRFTGTQLVDGYECDVRAVQVVAQPVAAFLWQLHAGGQAVNLQKYSCLTVDIGYRTVDWACTRGLKLVDPRCGSAPGGVHRLVRHISEAFSQQAGEDCSSFSMRARIEASLRDRSEFIEVGTRRFAMKHFMPTVQKLIEQSLLPMIESIGTATDITDIHLVGGGCELYASALAMRFPHKRLIRAVEPQFAIVRGLQLLADRPS